MELKGIKAWIASAPKNEEEWEKLEIGWCKTYLENGIPISKDYFSDGIEIKAKKELRYERD